MVMIIQFIIVFIAGLILLISIINAIVRMPHIKNEIASYQSEPDTPLDEEINFNGISQAPDEMIICVIVGGIVTMLLTLLNIKGVLIGIIILVIIGRARAK